MSSPFLLTITQVPEPNSVLGAIMAEVETLNPRVLGELDAIADLEFEHSRAAYLLAFIERLQTEIS